MQDLPVLRLLALVVAWSPRKELRAAARPGRGAARASYSLWGRAARPSACRPPATCRFRCRRAHALPRHATPFSEASAAAATAAVGEPEGAAEGAVDMAAEGAVGGAAGMAAEGAAEGAAALALAADAAITDGLAAHRQH